MDEIQKKKILKVHSSKAALTTLYYVAVFLGSAIFFDLYIEDLLDGKHTDDEELQDYNWEEGLQLLKIANPLQYTICFTMLLSLFLNLGYP